MAAKRPLFAAMFAGLMSAIAAPPASPEVFGHCTRMSLPVERVTPRPNAYDEFCHAHPGDCDMTGPPVIALNSETLQALNKVNREVNTEFRLTDDFEWRGKEEEWSYPSLGTGDCEDFALEKKRRLVNRGLSRAAITIGIAYHKEFKCPHAMLFVETNDGTIVLDNLQSEILCWDKAPYNYESRERPDGRWDRFDQRRWEWRPLRPR